MPTVLTPSSGNDRLTGSSDQDSIDGLAGNDTLSGLQGDDVLIGNLGNDALSGGQGNDTLSGDAGEDTLDGGAGADSLGGGTGNDRYRIDHAGDSVLETSQAGTDTVQSAISLLALFGGVENLELMGFANLNGGGNELANRLTGNPGNNRLFGGAGADTLLGGAGNDTLDGGDGADNLQGGDGADIYYVGSAQDKVTEPAAGKGVDTVISSVDYTLKDNLETLQLAGGTAVRAIGNGLDNTLTGNGAGNLLAGKAGNDSIDAGGGNDSLSGDGGDDVLIGGAGADRALYAGKRGDYALTYQADTASWIIKDKNTTDGDDGTDHLTTIEALVFGDQIQYLGAGPSLSIQGITVDEGDDGSAGVTVTVSLSAASSQAVTVNYATVNGTATAGSDYLAATGTLSFAPDETSKTIELTINGDTTLEASETFRVALSAPVGASLINSAAAATVTLQNDDPLTVTSVEVPNNGTYRSGDVLTFKLHASDVVSAGGAPRLVLSVGDAVLYANYRAGSGTNTLTFAHTIAAGELDADGIGLTALDLNGARPKDAFKNSVDLALKNVAETSGILVDGAAPTVVSVEVPAGAAYKAGDALSFTLNAGEAVAVTGAPRLALNIGGNVVYADYVSGSGSNALLFTHTITTGEKDSDGIEFSGSVLQSNGATLQDAAGNAMKLTLAGIADTAGITVDGVAPQVVSVSVPASGRYKAGDALTFTVTSDEAVTVGGVPRLGLKVGDALVYADYVSGSGSSALLFTHTVAAGELDTDGVTLFSPLDLNGGTLQDALGNGMVLALNGLGATGGVTIDSVAPSVVSVSVPADAAYKAGSTLKFTVNSSEAVTVSGTPRLSLDVGGTTVYADYASGSGTTALAFSYTVGTTELDSDGIALAAALDLNSATLQDKTGNAMALELAGVAVTTGITIDSVAPSVSTVTVPSKATYKAGDTLTFTVNTSEAIVITGKPRFGLDVGGTTVYADYASGSGTSALVFSHSVGVTEQDGDGLALASANLDANGGTLKDLAGNSMALALNGVGTLADVSVDGSPPTLTITSSLARFKAADTATLTFTFSETPLGFDSNDVSATGGTLASLTADSTGKVYSGTFTPTAATNTLSGTIDVAAGSYTDLAGNAGLGNSFVVLGDTLAPTLTGSSPADKATAVALSGNMLLTFSEAVAAGTGNLLLSAGGDTRTIAAGDTSQVTVSNNTVTINPTLDLSPNAVYNLQMASGVITDLAGNAYAGLATATALTFTMAPPTSALGLSALNGSNGFRLDGAATADLSGYAVHTAGDINGDGYDDLLIGALRADPSGNTDAGAAYLVYGKALSFASSLALSALDGISGFRLNGVTAGDLAGSALSAAGDVNGDGAQDMIIGAPAADPNGADSGASYLVFGQATGFSSSLNLTNLNGSSGFRLDGPAPADKSGTAVSTAGDVNGDGYDDLIIGAQGADPNGAYSGAAYLVFGKASGFSAATNLSGLNGTTGFRLEGVAARDYAGHAVGTAGDINGDGYDDLLVGAHGADPNGGYSGAGYVLFGKASGFSSTLNLSTLNGTTGFRLDGAAALDRAGFALNSAGDVNGDGYDDLIIGAYAAGPNNNTRSGSSYVFFGKASGFSSAVNLSTLNGATGFRLDGVAAGDLSGRAVDAAGDVNGDGFDDLLVGAWEADPNGVYSGASYLVLGKSSGFNSAVNLSSLDGNSGFRLDGVALGDKSGWSVSSAGDLNGDGFDDLLLGAQWADPGSKTNAGSSYVFFGSNSTGAVNYLGSAAAEALASTAATVTAERLVGGGGNDTLTGGGGADIFYGGSGTDLIVVADLTFKRVDGGGGNDTLQLTGTGLSLDMANFRNKIAGLEAIDITGSGNNTLTLAGQDLAHLSGSSNTLTLEGNSGDALVLSGTGWSDSGTIGYYHVFTQGANRLQVNPALTTPDVVLPTLVSSSPADNATGVAISSNIVLTFSEAVALGTGNIVVSNGSDTRTIAVTSATQVGVSGSTVTINPTADLNYNTTYYVQIAAGAIKDLVGNAYAGISDTTTLNFTIPPASIISLSTLSGGNGFRLDGVAAHDYAGRSLSSAGDVNGDGLDDLLIAAPEADPGAVGAAGSSYVVFGQSTAFGATLNLSTLNGTTGLRLDGVATLDYSGRSVSGAGDVNGDGYADIIVGASWADANGNTRAGSSYLVFGKVSGFGATLDLSSLSGTGSGMRLDGVAASDYAGFAVSTAGDINGDGFDDLLIGAYRADPGGISSAGSSYLVFGKAAGFAASLNLSTLNGSTGFRMDGVGWYDAAGRSVGVAGDVNGDGYNDLVIGAPTADPNGSDSGSAYVVFGKASSFASSLNLSTLNGTTGFRLDGAAAGDLAGRAVATAGDINGDGYADLIVGAKGADANGSGSGSSYVVFGKASAFTSALNLSTLNGSTGFRLDGAAAGDGAGVAVSGMGDFNGDGYDDLLVGADYADQGANNAGAAYVIYGQAAGFASTVNLSSLNGNSGFRLDGVAASDFAGQTVSAAGDVNGDGFDDVLVGAKSADPNFILDAGSSYLVLGGNATSAVNFLGTGAADTLNASTAAAERFVAGAGDDAMTGGGGGDVFYGGLGNDTVNVPALTFQRADGGGGSDTLALTGAGMSLTLVNWHYKIESIEIIDLTGSGNNTLTLTAVDVLNASDAGNTLMIKGNAGDVVNAVLGAGYTTGADQMIGLVTYHTYSNGQAVLLVGTTITGSDIHVS